MPDTSIMNYPASLCRLAMRLDSPGTVGLDGHCEGALASARPAQPRLGHRTAHSGGPGEGHTYSCWLHRGGRSPERVQD